MNPIGDHCHYALKGGKLPVAQASAKFRYSVAHLLLSSEGAMNLTERHATETSSVSNENILCTKELLLNSYRESGEQTGISRITAACPLYDLGAASIVVYAKNQKPGDGSF
jgi:hypothetical protein